MNKENLDLSVCLESANKIKMPLDILTKSILKLQKVYKCDVDIIIESFKRACESISNNPKLLDSLLNNKTCYCRVIIKANTILQKDLKKT
jgi:hypothetical protein